MRHFIVKDWSNDAETYDEAWSGFTLEVSRKKPKYYPTVTNKRKFVQRWAYIFIGGLGVIHIPYKALRKAWDALQDKIANNEWPSVEFLAYNPHLHQIQIYGEKKRTYTIRSHHVQF